MTADGRFHYIETGSLISIKKNVEGVVIPSEEIKVKMFPMESSGQAILTGCRWQERADEGS